MSPIERGGEKFARVSIVIHHQRAHAFQHRNSRTPPRELSGRSLSVAPSICPTISSNGAYRQVDGEGRSPALARTFDRHGASMNFDQMFG
jgi:hypothetical protein